MHPRHEMLDLVVVDGRARGIVVRDLVTGKIESPRGRRGGAGHRRLRQRLLPVDQRQGLQRHRDLARAPQGRAVRQPVLHPDPPDLHPGHRRPPVEADADERVAAQRRPDLGAEAERRRPRAPTRSPRTSATTTSSGRYPRFGNLVAARHRLPRGQGGVRRGPRRRARRASASTSTSPTRSSGWAATAIEERYGNLFDMYERITGEDPYAVADADLPGACTTRWAGCGSTTT